MGDHSDSDSDSSPKSSSSSSSSSSPSARRRSLPQRGRAHSDESGSSDGVLVELPAQEAPRSPGADPDGGVLVNMPTDDATSGETFEDAPDDLAAASPRSARSLDESMAVIDFPEASSAGAELRKYQEEEVFAREAVAHRRMLQEMVGKEASLSLHGEDPDETPLHSMLDDCSRLVLELKLVGTGHGAED